MDGDGKYYLYRFFGHYCIVYLTMVPTSLCNTEYLMHAELLFVGKVPWFDRLLPFPSLHPHPHPPAYTASPSCSFHISHRFQSPPSSLNLMVKKLRLIESDLSNMLRSNKKTAKTLISQTVSRTSYPIKERMISSFRIHHQRNHHQRVQGKNESSKD